MAIGGDAPVSVQTMTAGYTYEIDACVAEINRMAAAGADIVRVAVPERKDTAALTEILRQTRVPIVADVHFHYKRALEAIEAGESRWPTFRDGLAVAEVVEAVLTSSRTGAWTPVVQV